MRTINRALIDMDGVVVDLVPAVLRQLGITKCPYEREENRGELLSNVLKKSIPTLWGRLDEGFWANIPKTKEADEIIAFLRERFDHLCFCTSPMPTPGCADGKVKWAHKHYPDIPVLLTSSSSDEPYFPPKWFAAGPNSLLLDDDERNVRVFRQNRGHAVLFPRKWNAYFHIVDPFAYVKQTITELSFRGY